MSDTTAAAAPSKRRRDIPYADASPQRLARTPARAPLKRKPTSANWRILKRHMEARLNMLRSWRFSWVEHYTLLETYLMPRRGIFINAAQPTPNTMIRGAPINQAILDPTATYASRRCSAGMMSGLMSPSRQWFKLKPALFPRDKSPPEAVAWFEEVEDRIYTVMGRSNFYESGAQMFDDLVNFGTGPMLIYEDTTDLIRCYTPCCGEYFVSSSSANRVETFARLFVMTISAIVEMFGLENCPADVQRLWQDKGGALEVEKLVAHMIEPNSSVYAPGTADGEGVIPGAFTWREAYWIWGSSGEWPLSLEGFADQPHLVPRWAVTSNDAYGRSVGMDVLPDIMQLQMETARKAEAIEKIVRPPMLASMEMKNEPASILPGKVTYVASLDAGKGMRPVFEVNPNLADMKEDLKEIQLRIKEGFFNDLFVQLEMLGQKQMTAYEVAQRNQEKLQIIGPVVERLQNEALAPAIKRVFNIMARQNLLPPLPDALQGVSLGLDFVGVLALAQRAAKSASIERFSATVSQLHAAEQPGQVDSVMDLWNRDETVREYADELFISKKILNTPKQVAAIRAQKAKAAQAQQQMAQVTQAADVGKTLGQTDVGGGMSAMSLVTGLGGAQPSAGQ